MADTEYHHIRTTATAPPVGCPIKHDFTPLAAVYVADPHPVANRMREESPVVFAEELGYVVVSRMDHITEVFLSPNVYSSENVQDPVFPLCVRVRCRGLRCRRRCGGAPSRRW